MATAHRTKALAGAVAALFVTLSPTGFAQLAKQVKDINTGVSANSDPMNQPKGFTPFRGYMYFAADNSGSGRELWRTDGTPGGTEMVKDINPGEGGSDPDELTVSGDYLFFTASDRFTGGLIGPELYVTDGTGEGTHLVKDLRADRIQFGSDPSLLTDVNGTLFFIANDGISGYELWKTNGTGNGTVLVKDIRPGPGPGDPFDAPLELTNVNGLLFFQSCSAPSSDCELWKSDGTAAGTGRVKDISPGTGSSLPRLLTSFNGLLFFAAQDPSAGRELWKSDGTEAGTVRVKDINAGAAASSPTLFTIGNGGLYFAATGDATGREVWNTDGTEGGTVPVTDLNPAGGPVAGTHLVRYVTAVGDLVFFVLMMNGSDAQLWRTNGSPAGTFMIGDHLLYESPTNVNGTLYTGAFVPNLGWELWKSDGSVAGTTLVKDIFPGPGDGNFNFFEAYVDLNGVLIFHANDGESGLEPWRSDGTAAGTTRIVDLNTGAGSASPSRITAVGKSIYFAADDGLSGEELWRSDGVTATTVRVKDIFPGSVPSRPRALTNNNSVLFLGARGPAAPSLASQLWKSDGTQAGTVLVKSGVAFPFLVNEEIVAINGIVYFNAGPTNSDIELWKSDGTDAGTTRVKDIRAGSLGSSPSRLMAVDGVLYFLANDGVSGTELWKSNGTEAGTVMVKDIRPGSGSGPAALFSIPMLAVNGVVYFGATDGVHGFELWKTDGTEVGTVMVKDIFPGPGSSNIRSIVNVGGTLFFDADDGASGREIWKSDGTQAGTMLVRDIRAGAGSPSPRALTSVGDALFFLAIDGVTGVELWTSDGTTEGTRLVKDLDPGLAPSQPEFGFAIIDAGFDKCLFAASDGLHGLELWRSDGTAAGTVLVADIAAGPASSSPRDLTVVGHRLFFSANDNVSGRELYEIPGVAVQLPEAAVRALSDRFRGLGRNRRVPPALVDDDPFITRF